MHMTHLLEEDIPVGGLGETMLQVGIRSDPLEC